MSVQKIKNSFTSNRFKSGAYSSFITVIVVAIVILINLVVAKMDLSADLSEGSLFTVSKEAKQAIKDIENNITIYYMVEEGQEIDYIEKALEPFEAVSKKIKIVKKDPVLYPTFASAYTEETISMNDVIVVNEDTNAAKYISNTDLYVTGQDYTTGSYTYSLDVEGQITSAISHVTNGTQMKMYVMSGHQEIPLGASTKAMIEKLNIEVNDLTLSDGSIPKDCEILFINGPQGDLLEEEMVMIKEYLENGGKAIINTCYTGKKQPNMASLLEYYGVSIEKGVVYEAKQGYYYMRPTYLVPEVNADHEITKDIQIMIVPGAQGLHLSDEIRSTVSATSILDTTEDSYTKTDANAQTVEKEKGDEAGPFSVGVAITETLKDEETKLVVYTAPYAFDDQYTSLAQLGNGDVLSNTVSWMMDADTQAVSVPAKNLSYSTVTLSTGSMIGWAIVVIVLIPLGIFVTGFVVWMMRRKS